MSLGDPESGERLSMSLGDPEEITVGERIGQLAADHPTRPAVVAVAPDGNRQTMTWARLESESNAAAHALAEAGVGPESTVTVVLSAGVDHVVATIAVWKLGGLVVPLDPHATPSERRATAAAIGEHISIGGPEETVSPLRWCTGNYPEDPLPSRGVPRSASLTGGTTGQPRVVRRRKPWTYRPDALLSESERARGMRLGQVQLVVLPMYHAGFSALYQGLVLDHQIVLMERFVPRLFPRLVQEHRVSYLRIVPALMRMVLDVPDLAEFDLSSIEAVHHGAGPCPEEVKRRWLDLIGAERVVEDYASQERVGSVLIRGDEWLAHPGSVGRPSDCEVRILDEYGTEVATGVTGEIYLRSTAARQPEYVGTGPALPERDGFLSLGDLGYLDAEGYLYLVDRKSNVINVGGANVYPAEIEAVLLGMPAVADAVVVPRSHRYLGQVPHAMVVPADAAGPPSAATLSAYCRERLSPTKVPMSYEIVTSVARKTSGKISRRSLVGRTDGP
ncbi:AMP-binding protein [Micromonospora sp. NPDC050397]|uniref:AMP-binding protein n=1 Tax=Micromonospora sp. NPDC050397 TaxID=3364279 RepID=UPI00384DFEF2